jgi:dienelactone hydrolase
MVLEKQISDLEALIIPLNQHRKNTEPESLLHVVMHAQHEGPPQIGCTVGPSWGIPLVLVHHWWGLDSDMLNVAQELSYRGFRVLALDLFSGQRTSDPNRAWYLSNQINKTSASENCIRGSMNHLGNFAHIMGVGFGATLSCLTAENVATVRSVVALQNTGNQYLTCPRPLLYIAADQDPYYDEKTAQNRTSGPLDKLIVYGTVPEFWQRYHANYSDTLAQTMFDRITNWIKQL